MGDQVVETDSKQTVIAIEQLLDSGEVVEASKLAVQASVEMADQPRIFLRILDALSKELRDAELLVLIAKIESLNILPIERQIFMLRVKFREGDYRSASQLLNRILELSPQNAEALRIGARIGNLTRDYDTALQYWERLAHVSPQDSEPALQMARARSRRKQYDEALSWARRALIKLPDSEELLQIAAQAGRQLGWPQDCDQILVRLVFVNREQAINLASSLSTELTPDSAARMLSVLGEQFPNDYRLLEVANEACAQWLVAALERELASQDIEAAIYYRAIRQVRPKDVDIQRAIDRLSRPSVLAMRDAFNNRRFANAIEHGVVTTRIDPNCFEAWQTVGRSHFSNGDIAEALEAFRHCIDLNGKDARTWLTYGLMLNQFGDRLRALAAYQNAHRYAMDAEPKRETEASIAALLPALIRDAQEASSGGNVLDAWRLYDAAASIRAADDEVEQLRQQLLRRTKENIRALWNSQSIEGIDLCRKYLSKAPGDIYVQTVLARTLMKTRSYEEALTLWEGLAGRNLSDSHLHLQIARCCRSLKHSKRGIEAATEAHRLDASLQEAADLIGYFQGL